MDAHPVAEFSDGTEIVVKCITMGDTVKGGGCGHKGALWEKGDYIITKKNDRSPMLQLKYQDVGAKTEPAQICQTHIRHFGDPNHEVRQALSWIRFWPGDPSASFFFFPQQRKFFGFQCFARWPWRFRGGQKCGAQKFPLRK